MTTRGGTRTPWQVPEGGLKAEEQMDFWKRVKMVGEGPHEHWLWTGTMIGRPSFFLRGVYVSAPRIAWGLRYKDQAIPEKLLRDKTTCPDERCVRPDCHAGQSRAVPAPALREEINRVATGSDLRTVEALAAIQFGLPIKPRTLPALRRKAELDEIQAEIITAPEEMIVEKPTDMLSFVPNETEAAVGPKLTAAQMLAIIFEPDTIVMTFKTGHVWIMKPNVKVDADSPQDAIHGVLQLTGKHQVRG